MKEKIKKYAIPFIKEMLPVIVGILIALFIDNWNSNRKDKIYMNQVFATINSELNESKENIVSNMPMQVSLADSLSFYANDKDKTILDIVLKSKGVFGPKVRINAWKSVSNNKIDLIDYKKITILSDIEEGRTMMNNKTEFLMSYLYNNLNETQKDKKLAIKLILLDIIQTEKTILSNIDQFEEIK